MDNLRLEELDHVDFVSREVIYKVAELFDEGKLHFNGTLQATGTSGLLKSRELAKKDCETLLDQDKYTKEKEEGELLEGMLDYYDRVIRAIDVLLGVPDVLDYDDVAAKANQYFEDTGMTDEKVEELRQKKDEAHEEDVQEPEEDLVNSPSHYNQDGLETIEKMERLFGSRATAIYCLINTKKYEDRANYKHGGKKVAEDKEKALWYYNYAEKLSNKVMEGDEVLGVVGLMHLL